ELYDVVVVECGVAAQTPPGHGSKEEVNFCIPVLLCSWGHHFISAVELYDVGGSWMRGRFADPAGTWKKPVKKAAKKK
ncbi:MAG: hypothetical protein DI538_16360, partial [Azospira oryzae]